MMTSKILKSVDFTKTQKSRSQEWNIIFSSNKFFLQIINYTSRATLSQINSFVAEKTFKGDVYLHPKDCFLHHLHMKPAVVCQPLSKFVMFTCVNLVDSPGPIVAICDIRSFSAKAHFMEKGAFCLLAPPKLMPFFIIPNEDIYIFF